MPRITGRALRWWGDQFLHQKKEVSLWIWMFCCNIICTLIYMWSPGDHGDLSCSWNCHLWQHIVTPIRRSYERLCVFFLSSPEPSWTLLGFESGISAAVCTGSISSTICCIHASNDCLIVKVGLMLPKMLLNSAAIENHEWSKKMANYSLGHSSWVQISLSLSLSFSLSLSL